MSFESQNPKTIALLQQVKAQAQSIMRYTWVPITEERDGSPTDSKFSGIPYLTENATWPQGDNGRPMQLFLQLNLQNLPSELKSRFGEGILQVFGMVETNFLKLAAKERGILSVEFPTLESYDIAENRDDWCGDFRDPFDPNMVARIIQPAEDYLQPKPPNLMLSPRVIVGWERYEGYPTPDLRSSNSSEDIMYFDETDIPIADEIWDDYVSNYVSQEAYLPICDRLAGWPDDITSERYPNCPICQQPMKNFIFQIAGEDNLNNGNFGWGPNAEVLYIVQCPQHLDQVTGIVMGS